MRKRLDINTEIAAVRDLARDQLVAAWMKTYGCPPPKGVKRELLERSAAWHLQAKRLGGLPSSTRKALGSIDVRPTGLCLLPAANAAPSSNNGTAPTELASSAPVVARKPGSVPPKVGSRLMREWNGRMHIVEVVHGGFVLDGKTFRSLTAVARRITGTHWSGPRFFGL
ncbi:DUF2924 domain-containing protein [Mesorhizobium sp. M3A.F.Ca.ET.174.01.1.1]|uniref:DUF2924 domain-containing protein n=1 Tax=unclassified Mesorhizobium TaxID=325217 RepID=UPI001093882F|nr:MULTISPECIES: DUF2924 domain-containing protein [unclassified Mesorhizobium]TGS84461.1 DUF2924 domain-containing protein [Mesorhizobium sp. M3A.F.Ca.ET.175.01.1.1]TGT25688.1 DUF2924 domain-containing protein [Mesorhizobium sp. M3A.F.Ca.ET.174.01.1.1]